ncbi:hypothetical protein CLOM_g9684 [Closterium sp. NIES-68]|nr:hypothetical protein CLOM_g9684 [Closterium sp. NIES-68]
MLVELKNGETYNGHLVSCDTWMNIHLREVICTSKDGDRFWRMPQCYVRGNTIKYLRVPDEVIDKVQEEVIRRQDRRPIQQGRGEAAEGGWTRGEGGEEGGGEGGTMGGGEEGEEGEEVEEEEDQEEEAGDDWPSGCVQELKACSLSVSWSQLDCLGPFVTSITEKTSIGHLWSQLVSKSELPIPTL